MLNSMFAEGVSYLEVSNKIVHEFHNASLCRIEDLKAKRKAEDETERAKKRAAQKIKEPKFKKIHLLQEKDQELSEIDKKLKCLIIYK